MRAGGRRLPASAVLRRHQEVRRARRHLFTFARRPPSRALPFAASGRIRANDLFNEGKNQQADSTLAGRDDRVGSPRPLINPARRAEGVRSASASARLAAGTRKTARLASAESISGAHATRRRLSICDVNSAEIHCRPSRLTAGPRLARSRDGSSRAAIADRARACAHERVGRPGAQPRELISGIGVSAIGGRLGSPARLVSALK